MPSEEENMSETYEKFTNGAKNLVFLGEAGLSGEIRAVSNIKLRVAEAARLGFSKAVIPAANLKAASEEKGITLIPVKTIMDVLREDIYV